VKLRQREREATVDVKGNICLSFSANSPSLKAPLSSKAFHLRKCDVQEVEVRGYSYGTSVGRLDGEEASLFSGGRIGERGGEREKKAFELKSHLPILHLLPREIRHSSEEEDHWEEDGRGESTILDWKSKSSPLFPRYIYLSIVLPRLLLESFVASLGEPLWRMRFPKTALTNISDDIAISRTKNPLFNGPECNLVEEAEHQIGVHVMFGPLKDILGTSLLSQLC